MKKTADLMLYTLDLYQLWLSERKRIMSHQTRVERFINDTAAYIESHNLEDRYELRFNRIREDMSELFKREEEPLRGAGNTGGDHNMPKNILKLFAVLFQFSKFTALKT